MTAKLVGNSIKPYFLRAFYAWCEDNGLTPHISVFINDQVQLPRQYIADETITLNISASACSALQIDNHYLSVTLRFSGVSHAVLVPIANILSIFARENGQSMEFPFDSQSIGAVAAKPPTLTAISLDTACDQPMGQGALPETAGKAPKNKPVLHIIK